MAFVPQDDILFEQLTVEDNILYAAILFNKVECIRQDRFEED